MDFIGHALWGYVIAALLDFTNWPEFVFFSVFPDIIFGIPALATWWYWVLRKKRFPTDKETRNLIINQSAPIRKFYYVGHSFLTILVFAVFNQIVYGKFALGAIAAWSIHSFLDLFMHKGGLVTATPLYPLKYTVKGWFHWSEKWFLVANYAVLVIVYVWLFFLR